jgi:hypothetical protein
MNRKEMSDWCLSVFTGGMVAIKLRKLEREIYVHKKLLQSRSPYFAHVLTGCHAETTTIAVNEVDANTFCQFLSWLYSNRFITPEEDEWMGLCRLWLLAEKFQVRGVFSCSFG